MCIIPKPGKADYSAPKCFCPILLLECMGKLVKKVIAWLMYKEIIQGNLIPTNQFGGCMASSTVNTGLCLIHNVQNAHTTGLRTGICLFDISGFFNNVNCPRLVQLIQDLGFMPEIIRWCSLFLADRCIWLKFNGILSDPMDSMTGTPQGSPISPILSIIYTSPLLHRVRDWTRASFGMYIDDGTLFACADNWEEVAESLSTNYFICIDWLTYVGMVVEPDKTELLFFRKQQEKVEPPSSIHLHIPTISSYYQVKASTTICYLSFYIDHRL